MDNRDMDSVRAQLFHEEINYGGRYKITVDPTWIAENIKVNYDSVNDGQSFKSTADKWPGGKSATVSEELFNFHIPSADKTLWSFDQFSNETLVEKSSRQKISFFFLSACFFSVLMAKKDEKILLKGLRKKHQGWSWHIFGPHTPKQTLLLFVPCKGYFSII